MIRRAVLPDIPQIKALMKSIDGFWDQGWRTDVLERALGSLETIALVHHKKDTIDGFICGHDVGFRAYLSELVVSPSAQGHGVGSELLFELEKGMAERGCCVLMSDVWRNAEEFYLSHGWSPPHVVLLRKRLNSSGIGYTGAEEKHNRERDVENDAQADEP